VILVDTTVWVDLFAGKSTPHAERLEHSLATGEDVCTCGVILTEVLQGIRADEEYRRTLARFDALLYLPMDRQLFIRAAELYRRLRNRGITIRKPIDCMIAAVAIRHDVMLLHNDRDFDPIEKHCELKVVKVIRKPARGLR
jgi:hypothetical protein